MEAFSGKERLTILRRLIAYAEKVFQLSNTVVAGVMDRRRQPRIPASRIVKSVAALFWARMGSLNALELAAHSSFFRRWLGQPVCSADSLGRVTAHIYKHDPDAIECFLLMAFLACNIFQAFSVLNLKPQIRNGRTRAFWSTLMAAEILDGVNPSLSP